MTDWITRLALGSLWALVWHFGIIAGVMILALAAAYFSPLGKKFFLVVALCAAFTLITAGIYTKLGADYVQAKWEAAQRADLEAAAKARAGADKAVPAVADPRFARGMRHDKYNRDLQHGFPTYHILRFKGHPADHPASPGP